MHLLSKFVIFLLQPAHLFIFLLAAAAAASFAGFTSLSRFLAWSAAIFIAIAIGTPLGDHLLYALENRAKKPTDALERAQGAIILGGGGATRAFDPTRDRYMLNEAGERMTAILALRQAKPEMPILFTGGSGMIVHEGIPESQLLRNFLEDVGFDPASIRYEERSRNTVENAQFSAAMLKGEPGPFLLVTSASHMPRALGVFRKAGLDVIPYPVDYRQWRPKWSLLEINEKRLERMGHALREYVGLLGYYLLGRSDALWPK